jgi:excisionase family DNA binding protein
MTTDAKPVKNVRFQIDLLSRLQAAEYLGISAKTLAVWACTKRYNLPYVKIGRLVKYNRADLEAFIAERTTQRTDRD